VTDVLRCKNREKFWIDQGFWDDGRVFYEYLSVWGWLLLCLTGNLGAGGHLGCPLLFFYCWCSFVKDIEMIFATVLGWKISYMGEEI